MTFFDPTQPLGLPRGSVRAIIALSVVVAFVLGFCGENIGLLVLGFYFGSRSSVSSGS